METRRSGNEMLLHTIPGCEMLLQTNEMLLQCNEMLLFEILSLSGSNQTVPDFKMPDLRR